jgi:hypothetical protein
MYSEVFEILVAECSTYRLVKDTPAENIVGGVTHIRHKIRKSDLEKLFDELTELKGNTWYKIYLSFLLVNLSGAAYRSILPLYRSGKGVTDGINLCPYWAPESFVEFKSTYQYEPLNVYVGESTGNLIGNQQTIDQHKLVKDPLDGILYSSIGQLPLVKPKTENTHDRFRQNLQPSSPSQFPAQKKMITVVTPVSKRLPEEVDAMKSQSTFSPTISQANILSKKPLTTIHTSIAKKKKNDVEEAMEELSELIIKRTKSGVDHYKQMIVNLEKTQKAFKKTKATPPGYILSHIERLEELIKDWNIHRAFFHQEFQKFDQFTKKILAQRYQ